MAKKKNVHVPRKERPLKGAAHMGSKAAGTRVKGKAHVQKRKKR